MESPTPNKPSFAELIRRVDELEAEAERYRRDEAALRERERRLDALLNNLPGMAYRCANDKDWTMKFVSRGCRALTGYDASMLIENRAVVYGQVILPEDRQWVFDQVQTALDQERPFRLTYRIRTAQGEIKWVWEQGAGVSPRGRSPTELEGFITDITDRRRAEKELGTRQKYLESVLHSAPDAIVTLDADHRVLEWNPGAEQIFGFARDEVIGRNLDDLVTDPTVRGEARGFTHQVLNGGKLPPTEVVRYRKDQTPVHVIAAGSPIVVEGRVLGVVAVYTDISPLKRVEKALRRNEKQYRALYATSKRSEEIYRSLLNSSADPIVIYDMEGRVEYLSPAFTNLFGWRLEELQGQRIPFVPESEQEKTIAIIRHLIDEGRPCRLFQTQRLTKDGRLLDISISASRYADHENRPAGMLAILRDVSDRKRLEGQLLQAQKMEAIGTLAGGIAHDFNNILGAIIGYTELAHYDAEPGSMVKLNMEHVLKAGHRAKDLVKQILTFSRRSEQEKRPIQVAPIVTEALTLLRASIPTTVEIIPRIGTRRGVVLADPSQIHQILMNLCTNAAQAMEIQGGVLEVGLDKIRLAAYDPVEYPELNPGRYLKLSVRDNGCGMPLDVIGRIFDPYFTTKGHGKGTGLGLAVVHGIVQSLGGGIRVRSQPGSGSLFEVLLPAWESATVPEKQIAGPLPGGNERILLVDDELSLVSLEKQMLERLGYRVECRTSSVEALALFQARPDDFDLVLTDMTMPNMTGKDLAVEILTLRPGMPIILCTGYSEGITAESARDIGIRNYLMKPLSIKDLSRTIRKVLEDG